MSKEIAIGKRHVGLEHPAYFVADIAANHDGDLQRARDLIHLCAEAGADAAKFQNFRAETIVSDFGFRSLGSQLSHQASWSKSVFEVYEDASLPLEWTDILKETCDQAGIDYFTSPYDLDLVTRLSPHVCAWKLGSGDITWLAMIERLARDGKPLLIATGAADMQEVRTAMTVASSRTDDIVLMQCNTNYTGTRENLEYVALNVLSTYQREFPGVVLGLSDHTPGYTTVLGAVTLGARVIEKHFTEDTSRKGPDHGFSMNPASWREMVERTRDLEAALGPHEKRVMENERETLVLQRRAVRAAVQILEGSWIRESDLTVLRPYPPGALPPFRLKEVLGKKAARTIEAGDVVLPSDVE